MYNYAAKLVKVIDGDTVDFDVDLGFHMTARIRFRILGVDTPELRGGTDETKAKAREAKQFVIDELSNATTIRINTQKADSFGRWLASVTYNKSAGEFVDLTTELITEGLGVPYL